MVVPSKKTKENVSIKGKVTSEHEVAQGACFRCHSTGHPYIMLVKQAGTYARCFLVNNQRRSFAITTGFDQKHLVAWFLVFHRSGLSPSRPLSLGTQQGFKHVVKHIIGMLSIPDGAGYGLDVTRSQDIFSINGRYYQIVSLFYMRDSLRGRSTVVYNLDGTNLAYSAELGLRGSSCSMHRRSCL